MLKIHRYECSVCGEIIYETDLGEVILHLESHIARALTLVTKPRGEENG